METKTVAYTAETLAEIKAFYTTEREKGRLNSDILAELSRDFDRTVPSLRTKLMVEKVYVKDTDTEKEVKASAKIPKASAKEPKVTKLDTAKAIFTKLGIDADAETLKDFSKVKASTLAVLTAAVAAR